MSIRNRVRYLGWPALAIALLAGIQNTSADDLSSKDAALFEKARGIHSRIVAFDSHVDIPLNYGEPGPLANDLGTAAR